MWLIHRAILSRLLLHFVLLMGGLYLFATTIDVVLNLDAFSGIARRIEGPDAPWWTLLWRTTLLTLDYEWPQFFQFFAFLYGLVAIAAVGFTCLQMARAREFVAIAAAGIDLRRLAWPVAVLVLALAGLQILNQEFVLPQVSGLLLRGHGQAGQVATDAFRVPFTKDSQGTLLQAASFSPDTRVLGHPTFLHRDEVGRTTRRVWATSGRWDDELGGWSLHEGMSASTDATADGVGLRRTETFEPSTLTPEQLLVRRHGDFASMMSTPGLIMLASNAAAQDVAPLRRSLASRITMPLINMLCVLIAVPFFIDRIPTGLLGRSVMCCCLMLPLYMVSVGAQVIAVPGLGPVSGVLAPLVVLVPLALWRLGGLRT
jgi:lipopolysaccharide export LptBFGC system permease protein LptF